jgi:indole-3-acetate monooxygenase
MSIDSAEIDGAQTACLLDPVLALVRERADDTERTRRIPDEVLAALRRTGINRLLLPSALGGRQAGVADLMDVVERIAAVDGSTAWCAAIGAGSNVFAGYMPPAGARAVFADPDQPCATMVAPAGRIAERGGRTVLTGRWPFTSNCLHSTWIGLGALIEHADRVDPEPRIVFVPSADLTIEDTWDSVGLRGTGSHHVTADGVEITLERAGTFAARPWPDGDLWRLPLPSVLLPVLSAVTLGIARGALDEISRQAQQGRTARRGQITDDPISLAELATADTRLRAARAGVRETIDQARDLAERHTVPPRTLQARIALACLHSTDASVDATAVAHRLGGGDAAYSGSRLLRALGDVQAARQHLMFSHHHLGQLGRILLGADIAHPPLVL